MVEHGYSFGSGKKKRVREEQFGRCAICGAENHLTIHHIKPRGHGGTNATQNALGVCREPCHDILDMFAAKGIYYPEVLQERDYWNEVAARRDAIKKVATS